MKLSMFVTFGPGTEGIAAKSRKGREFNIHKTLVAFTLVETMVAISVWESDSRQRSERSRSSIQSRASAGMPREPAPWSRIKST